jgi:hypothetical protein
VHVITPLFQSGDAPSRGPRSIQGSTEQTASIFIHQYVIYTQTQAMIEEKFSPATSTAPLIQLGQGVVSSVAQLNVDLPAIPGERQNPVTTALSRLPFRKH